MGFIFKTPSLGGAVKFLPFLHNSDLTTESVVSFVVLPKFELLFEEIEKPMKFAPVAFKFEQSTPEEYVLYEDLQLKGFRPIQKDCNGLKTKQMLVVLNKLAAFHAASVVSVKFGSLYQNVSSSNKDLQILSNRIFHEHLRGYDLRSYEDKIVCTNFKLLNVYYFN